MSAKQSSGDPGILSFVMLAGGILVVVLLAAVMRTDPPVPQLLAATDAPVVDTQTDPLVEAPANVDTAVPPPSTDDPAEPLPPESVLDRMARRAGADVERLAASAEGWTAQVGVFCDALRVESIVAEFGEQPALLVLPSYHDDRPCFRVCWNRYRARDSAARATDLPDGLRALLSGDPYPRPVTEVLE
jgi:hypothetical protein